MEWEWSAEIWEWRGPAPFYFVSVPEVESADIAAASSFLTYGWGMIPATVRIGSTVWTTSLWPKDGGYVVPLKADVRRRERLGAGDAVIVSLSVRA